MTPMMVAALPLIRDRLSDNVRIAVEIALPDFVPENRHLFGDPACYPRR